MLKLVVSSWYIVNSGWVKNVNNLRMNSSKYSVYISTKSYKLNMSILQAWVKTVFYNLNLNQYSTHIYTGKKQLFNLLNKSFTYYPHNLLIEPIRKI